MHAARKTDTLDRSRFETYGILDRCYVKAVRRAGRILFEVRAADGTYLGRFDTRALADAALVQQDMEPHSVH